MLLLYFKPYKCNTRLSWVDTKIVIMKYLSLQWRHMSAKASQITGNSTVCSSRPDWYNRRRQISASMALCTGNVFPFPPRSARSTEMFVMKWRHHVLAYHWPYHARDTSRWSHVLYQRGQSSPKKKYIRIACHLIGIYWIYNICQQNVFS